MPPFHEQIDLKSILESKNIEFEGNRFLTFDSESSSNQILRQKRSTNRFEHARSQSLMQLDGRIHDGSGDLIQTSGPFPRLCPYSAAFRVSA